jgi:hypothetical protein
MATLVKVTEKVKEVNEVEEVEPACDRLAITHQPMMPKLQKVRHTTSLFPAG